MTDPYITISKDIFKSLVTSPVGTVFCGFEVIAKPRIRGLASGDMELSAVIFDERTDTYWRYVWSESLAHTDLDSLDALVNLNTSCERVVPQTVERTVFVSYEHCTPEEP